LIPDRRFSSNGEISVCIDAVWGSTDLQDGAVSRRGSTIEIHGRFTHKIADELRSYISDLEDSDEDQGVIDFSSCTGMEAVAAAELYDLIHTGSDHGLRLRLAGMSDRDADLLKSFERYDSLHGPTASGWNLRSHFEGVGEDVLFAWDTLAGLWTFTRNTFSALKGVMLIPGRFRWQLMFFYMEHAGVRAVPIIGVLCWLIGTVLGFQAGYQLKTFAAEMFMPDLIAYSITWEIGPLLAAVLVAGRSSSAFAAEIGTMKVRQEVDALTVMGFNIYEYLVTPKLIALFIVLPLLVLMADFFGLLGGLLIGGWYLDLPATYYISRLNFVMLPMDIWWGMLKGIVFAVIIANVGCYMGMRVRGGATAVGQATTAAVVAAIFLVIIADAFISVLFIQIRPTVKV